MRLFGKSSLTPKMRPESASSHSDLTIPGSDSMTVPNDDASSPRNTQVGLQDTTSALPPLSGTHANEFGRGAVKFGAEPACTPTTTFLPSWLNLRGSAAKWGGAAETVEAFQ